MSSTVEQQISKRLDQAHFVSTCYLATVGVDRNTAILDLKTFFDKNLKAKKLEACYGISREFSGAAGGAPASSASGDQTTENMRAFGLTFTLKELEEKKAATKDLQPVMFAIAKEKFVKKLKADIADEWAMMVKKVKLEDFAKLGYSAAGPSRPRNQPPVSFSELGGGGTLPAKPTAISGAAAPNAAATGLSQSSSVQKLADSVGGQNSGNKNFSADMSMNPSTSNKRTFEEAFVKQQSSSNLLSSVPTPNQKDTSKQNLPSMFSTMASQSTSNNKPWSPPKGTAAANGNNGSSTSGGAGGASVATATASGSGTTSSSGAVPSAPASNKAGGLTEEQKARIAKNREEALRRKALKQQAAAGGGAVSGAGAVAGVVAQGS
ncbi:unnamed protein product [Amoebophrya sp. A120]|nr:unnamed protein product [Amoebophrya sp. A120]|eukprot:GSA120T00017273001.1